MDSKYNIKFSIGDLVNYVGTDPALIKLNPWKVDGIGVHQNQVVLYSLESGKEYTHLPQGSLESAVEKVKVTTEPSNFKVGDLVDYIGISDALIELNPWKIFKIEVNMLGNTEHYVKPVSSNDMSITKQFIKEFLVLHTEEKKPTATNFKIGDLVDYIGDNSCYYHFNPWEVKIINEHYLGSEPVSYALESGKEYTVLPQRVLKLHQEKKMTTVNPKFKVGDLVDYIGTNQDDIVYNPWKIVSVNIIEKDKIYYSVHSNHRSASTSFAEDFLHLTEKNKMTNTNATTKKIYLVYSRDGKAESEFNTLQAAEEEARKLAETYIGEEFFVMESIAVASVKTTYEKL